MDMSAHSLKKPLRKIEGGGATLPDSQQQHSRAHSFRNIVQ